MGVGGLVFFRFFCWFKISEFREFMKGFRVFIVVVFVWE